VIKTINVGHIYLEVAPKALESVHSK